MVLSIMSVDYTGQLFWDHYQFLIVVRRLTDEEWMNKHLTRPNLQWWVVYRPKTGKVDWQNTKDFDYYTSYEDLVRQHVK
jgi:hypothetical protein